MVVPVPYWATWALLAPLALQALEIRNHLRLPELELGHRKHLAASAAAGDCHHLAVAAGDSKGLDAAQVETEHGEGDAGQPWLSAADYRRGASWRRPWASFGCCRFHEPSVDLLGPVEVNVDAGINSCDTRGGKRRTGSR